MDRNINFIQINDNFTILRNQSLDRLRIPARGRQKINRNRVQQFQRVLRQLRGKHNFKNRFHGRYDILDSKSIILISTIGYRLDRWVYKYYSNDSWIYRFPLSRNRFSINCY